jgi:hypothetical protein
MSKVMPDWQAQTIRVVLALLGLFMLVGGWLRFFG